MLEFILECIIDLIVDGWTDLMCLIVPSKRISTTTRRLLKLLIIVFCSILLVSMLFGLFMTFFGDDLTKALGRYLLFIPLAISAVQIVIGLILRKKRASKEDNGVAGP